VEEVPICDGPYEKAGLIEEGYYSRLLHLNQITDDFIVEVINLIKGKEILIDLIKGNEKL
jgi:hypothetical protein